MSKRNETVNRLYQRTKALQLNAIRGRFVRRLIEQAYDAGKAHGETAYTAGFAAGRQAERREWLGVAP